MLASRGSIGEKLWAIASQSIMSEPMVMAYREEIRMRTPCLRTPMMNSGIFNRMEAAPMGRMGIKWLRIWPTPVKPPIEILLG